MCIVSLVLVITLICCIYLQEFIAVTAKKNIKRIAYWTQFVALQNYLNYLIVLSNIDSFHY